MAYDKNIALQIKRRDRLAGLFFLGAMAILAIGLLVNRQQIGEFENKQGYFTEIKRAYGLAAGADVELSGVVIGKVKSVELQSSGIIRVDLDLYRRYQGFVTVGSHMEIPTVRGMSEILGAPRLHFVHNTESSAPLPPGSRIETIEPEDLASILKRLELGALADRVNTIFSNAEQIVANLEKTTSTIAAQDIGQVVDNSTLATERLAEAATSVNQVLAQVNEITRDVGNSREALPQIMASTDALLKNTDQLIQNMDRLMLSLEEVSQVVLADSARISRILSESEEMVENANQISDKVNQHWLLGPGKAEPQQTWSGFHPRLSSPYEEKPEQTGAAQPATD